MHPVLICPVCAGAKFERVYVEDRLDTATGRMKRIEENQPCTFCNKTGKLDFENATETVKTGMAIMKASVFVVYLAIGISVFILLAGASSGALLFPSSMTILAVLMFFLGAAMKKDSKKIISNYNKTREKIDRA